MLKSLSGIITQIQKLLTYFLSIGYLMSCLIIIGPSGVGKGTIVKELLQKHSVFSFTLSFTTRFPRPGQIPGKDYLFVSHKDFEQRITEGQMLQHKKVFTNYYGTSRRSFQEIKSSGKLPLLDIDLQGMKDIHHHLSKLPKSLPPLVLCLLPPSWKVLEERLRKRKSDEEEVIRQRLDQNKRQVREMLQLKGININYTTNFQFQSTIFGIEAFLSKQLQEFRQSFWRRGVSPFSLSH